MHTEVPVTAAEAIATKYKKTWVIINSFDANSQLLHTTTYGATYALKMYAARVGERIAKLLGFDIEQTCIYEDFRQQSISSLQRVKAGIYTLEDNTGTKLKETLINDIDLIIQKLK